MERMRKGDPEKGRVSALLLGKCLLAAYIVTGGLLMLLAFLLYRMDLSEKMVSVGIVAVYAVSAFLAGFLTGKKIGSRKFLWGLLMGTAYFAVLAVVSLCVNHRTQGMASDFFTTYMICAGSGMIGGMLG